MAVNFTIVQQPMSTTVLQGTFATFSAVATAFPPPNVQWQVSTDGGFSFNILQGATSTNLTVGPVQLQQNGTQYRAAFNNTVASMISSAATLFVVSPIFSVTPPSAITFSSVSSTLSKMISISNNGSAPLSVNQSMPLSQGSWFSISSGALPITNLTHGSGSLNLTITCSPPPLSPSNSTRFVDTLVLSTNDPTRPFVNISLICTAAPLITTSLPASSNVSFESVSSTLSKMISISNNGSAPLSVNQSIPFSQGSWFSISSGALPITNLTHGSGSLNLTITCSPPPLSPSNSTRFVDTLVLSTNDPTRPFVNISLICTAAPLITTSLPASSNVSFESVSSTLSKMISISNNGSAPLSVNQSIPFSQESWFSISSPVLPISISSTLSLAVNVTCTVPQTAQAPFVDTLVLSTNDPTRPFVNISLVCVPEFASSPPAMSTLSIQGSAYTQTDTTVTVSNFAEFSPLIVRLSLMGADDTVLSNNNSISNGAVTISVSPANESSITLQPSSTLDITISCIPTATYGMLSASLLISTTLQSFSYSIECTAEPSVVINVEPSLGMVIGGETTSGQLTISNQASVPISLSLTLSVSVGNIDSTMVKRQSKRSAIEWPNWPPSRAAAAMSRSTTSLQDDNAWYLFDSAATLSLSPSSLNLDPLQSQQVTLMLTPLLPFSFTATLEMTTPFVSTPVAVAQFDWFGVVPVLALVLDNSGQVDVGPIPVGASGQVSVEIDNVGNADLIVTGVDIVDPVMGSWLSVESAFPQLIASDLNMTIVIQCTPTQVGSITAPAIVSSNSPSNLQQAFAIACQGTASCNDGYQNQDETGIDCGGPCAPCDAMQPTPQPTPTPSPTPTPMPTTLPTPSPTPLPPPVMVTDAVSASDGSDSTIAAPIVQALSADGSPTTVTASSSSGLSVSVSVSSGGFSGTTLLIVSPIDAAALESATRASNVRIGSLAVDVTLSNGTTTLASPAQLCFSIEQGRSYKSACLGYIDSSGRWRCEDACLVTSSSGTICGSTSHFTNFAVLLSGGGGRQCTSSITGSWRGDLALAASVAGFVILLCVAVLAFGHTQTGRKVISGREGVRVSMLRAARSSTRSDRSDSESTNILG